MKLANHKISNGTWNLLCPLIYFTLLLSLMLMNPIVPPVEKWVGWWKDWIWNDVKVISKKVGEKKKRDSFVTIRIDIWIEFTITMVFEFTLLCAFRLIYRFVKWTGIVLPASTSPQSSRFGMLSPCRCYN